MGFQERTIDREYFVELKNRIRHNYQIADFYLDRFERDGEEKFLNKSKSIDNCCKFLDVDHYKMLKIKNMKRINLCKDKFCFNCQSVIALRRQYKYEPILDGFRKDYEVYHMVVTVPNCEGEELMPLLNRMYKKFKYLLRYFRGEAKVKGVDFLQYGYGGAVRGLEVTQNENTKEFHPHFHCMILFKKGLKLEYKNVNKYSYDKGKLTTYFSDLEILLQKIWFLIMNGKKVTAKAIAELPLGYSVHLSDSEGHYHEAFKYACKGAFDMDNGGFLYKEKTFWTLYEALNKRRMIQGYGALYNFNDEDGDLLLDEAEAEFDKIIEALNDFEKPIFKAEELDDVINNISRCTYIGKTVIRQLIFANRDELIAKHMLIADVIDDFFTDKLKKHEEE